MCTAMMTSVVSRLALGQRIRRCLLDNSKAFRNTRRFRSDEAPSVKPRTQEEIGQWVKKEMEGMVNRVQVSFFWSMSLAV